MHRKIAAFSLMAVLGAAAGSAQEIRTAPKEITAPDYNTVNCSGFVTDQKFPQEFRVISGEQSNYKLTFTSGDHVYINHGQDNGVRVGDRFFVVRPDDYAGDVEQAQLRGAHDSGSDAPWDSLARGSKAARERRVSPRAGVTVPWR